MRRTLSAAAAIVAALLLAFGFWHWTSSADKGSLIPLGDVPPALVEIAKAKLPDVSFDHARRLANGNFEIRGKAKNGKVREVETKPSGEIVEIE